MIDGRQWRDSGGYLPAIMRDFHDQKDIFKCMSESLDKYQKDNIMFRDIGLDWAHLQCLSIDVFLWFMARHGYTLQKSRANVEWESLDEKIKSRKDKEISVLRCLINQS